MIQHSFSKITIWFKETPNQFKDETALIIALKNFYNLEYNSEEDISFIILELESDRRMVNFELNCVKSIDLAFQINLLIEYIKSLKIKINSFNSIAYTLINSCSIFIGENEFNLK